MWRLLIDNYPIIALRQFLRQRFAQINERNCLTKLQSRTITFHQLFYFLKNRQSCKTEIIVCEAVVFKEMAWAKLICQPPLVSDFTNDGIIAAFFLTNEAIFLHGSKSLFPTHIAKALYIDFSWTQRKAQGAPRYWNIM